DPTGELNPGSYEDGWSVTVRFTWLKGNDMNLVQKGQGDPDGGIFKVKTSVPAAGQPEGYLKCLFRGANGVNSQTESYSAPRSNDGKWHTLRCDILPTGGTRMLLDGVVVNTNPKSPGIIWNDWPVTIGGDIKCGDTFCNYWHGAIGFVRFKGWDES
ncbi:MAG: hypothetical protein ACJ74E_06210, partial [Actinomycetes bacterium]